MEGHNSKPSQWIEGAAMKIKQRKIVHQVMKLPLATPSSGGRRLFRAKSLVCQAARACNGGYKKREMG